MTAGRRLVRRPAQGGWRLQAALACCLLAGILLFCSSARSSSSTWLTAITTSSSGNGLGVFKTVRGIHSRHELGAFLEADGAKTGAELGVQRGEFAARTLEQWPSCQKYILVDLWAKQANYDDFANVDDKAQEGIMQEARNKLEPWKDKLVWLRNLTSQAVLHVPDSSLDYIYVDARHDYCGVREDLLLWWPKLKPGGVFAGHDYLTANSEAVKKSGQDWSLCMDGTRHEGAVRGAVDEFAAAHGLLIMETSVDGGWESWVTRKPAEPSAASKAA